MAAKFLERLLGGVESGVPSSSSSFFPSSLTTSVSSVFAASPKAFFLRFGVVGVETALGVVGEEASSAFLTEKGLSMPWAFKRRS